VRAKVQQLMNNVMGDGLMEEGQLFTNSSVGCVREAESQNQLKNDTRLKYGCDGGFVPVE